LDLLIFQPKTAKSLPVVHLFSSFTLRERQCKLEHPALACYALWFIGLAVRSSGYRIEFGSRKRLRKLFQSDSAHVEPNRDPLPPNGMGRRRYQLTLRRKSTTK
jgi:hypothetical protein